MLTNACIGEIDKPEALHIPKLTEPKPGVKCQQSPKENKGLRKHHPDPGSPSLILSLSLC